MPVFFDLSNRGFAADPDARAFVVKARPVYGGRAVPTPKLLLMTAEGEVLGETSNYATEDIVLAKMLEVLAAHPKYNQPAEAEKRVASPVERAAIRIDLQDYAGACEALKGVQGDRAAYVRGWLARQAKQWDEMKAALAPIRDAALLDDVAMERAYEYWNSGDFGALAKALAAIPAKSNRYTEARYFLGLARYHGGKKERALEIWQATIKSCSEDPWVYRADWAYTQTKSAGGKRRMFSSAGPKTSCLNRIGYMGRKNPDLTR